MQLGYVSLPGRGANDRFLTDIVARLRSLEIRVAGTVQSNVERPDRAKCDMDIFVLPDGPVLRISEDRGDLARGCRLDAGVLEDAVLGVTRELPRAEMLIVNKFGKQEAEGRGMAPLIAEALGSGLPVLLGVNGLNVQAFRTFAAGLGTALPADRTHCVGLVPIGVGRGAHRQKGGIIAIGEAASFSALVGVDDTA